MKCSLSIKRETKRYNTVIFEGEEKWAQKETFIRLYGYIISMKTTILIEDKLYQKLVNQAIEKYGSAKNLSATLNEILQARFAPGGSMFGKLKPFPYKDLRDERDRAV